MGSYLSHSTKEQHGRQKAQKHLESQYDGSWSILGQFRRPKITGQELQDRILELEDGKGVYQKRQYLNPNGDRKEKYPDLDTYYSTKKEIPRRLVVQATLEAQSNPTPRHWGRRNIQGQVPFVIQLAEFCLNPLRYEQDNDDADDDQNEELDNNVDDHDKMRKRRNRINMTSLSKRIVSWIASTICILTLAWIIQVIVTIQIITLPWDDNSTDPYDNYENVDWYWPKHAVNPLDQDPENKRSQTALARLTVPRFLRVRDQQSQWVVKETRELRKATGMLPPYVFLSFSRDNYRDMTENERREFLDRAAEAVLKHENRERDKRGESQVDAFWVDTYCVSKDNAQKKTEDINNICDAVRCATSVYIVLPSPDLDAKRTWGRRVWTLPEALLAASKIRYICRSPTDDNTQLTFSEPRTVTLTEMPHSFWQDSWSREENEDKNEDDAIGLLISHYTNTLKLSDLQLFSCAAQALARRATTNEDKRVEGYDTTDLAYAAMGLLAHRVTPDTSDNNFQAIARLSLVNDSYQLLERLACLWPHEKQENSERPDKAVASSVTMFRNIANQDQYSTYLWDIKPLCNVVGIGNDEYTPTVIMDQCRAIPILWKNFPKVKYFQDLSRFRSSLSQNIVQWGSWFLATGLGIFSSAISLEFANLNFSGNDNQPQQKIDVSHYLVGVALYAGCAWIISWFSPLAVRQLSNGSSAGLSCHLVGFEGTMSLKKIEMAIFGNYNHRLKYAPSTILAKNHRHPQFREGKEPQHGWGEEAKKHNMSPRHRLFTIVDTGNCTVSVIAAERPPVVAVICGREGGQLRALLCSWRFDNNCLYRESVVRMRSELEHLVQPKDWLKLSLSSQRDVSRILGERGQQAHNHQSSSPTSPPSTESMPLSTKAEIVKPPPQAHAINGH
jgi:hypothetical protein